MIAKRFVKLLKIHCASKTYAGKIRIIKIQLPVNQSITMNIVNKFISKMKIRVLICESLNVTIPTFTWRYLDLCLGILSKGSLRKKKQLRIYIKFLKIRYLTYQTNPSLKLFRRKFYQIIIIPRDKFATCPFEISIRCFVNRTSPTIKNIDIFKGFRAIIFW
jgi:hypothetical protein